MTKKMTLLSLTLPIFFEMALRVLMGSSNTLMLSHFSDSAVAAVGVSNQILIAVIILFGFISSGTGVIVSQYLGAKMREKALEVVVASLVINLAFGLVVSLVMLLFGSSLLNMMGLPQDLMPYALIYLKIVGGISFLDAVSLVSATVIRSFGFTKDAMYVTIGQNVLNIFANYLVLFGPFGLPVLGVEGVAVSAAVARVIGIVAMLILLFRRVGGKLPFHILKSFPKEHVWKVLRIGFPSAGENLSYMLSQIAITGVIASLGTDVIAAKVYTETLMGYINILTNSIGQGTQILIGHLLGAGKKDEAYKLCLKSFRLAFVCAFLTSALLWVFCEPIFGLFTDSTAILTLASSLMLFTLILEPGRTFNVVIISSLVAAGDAKYPFTMGIISMWGIALGLSYVLGIGAGLGLIGVWIAYCADEWLRGVLMLRRWKHGKWRQISLVQPQNAASL